MDYDIGGAKLEKFTDIELRSQLKNLKDTSLNRLKHRVTELPMFLYLVINTYFCYPIMTAWFEIINDHEFISELKPGNRLQIWNIPSRLFSETEIGQFGSSERFRPFYYFLKFFLISIIGEFPSGYYLFRIFIHSFCAYLVFKLCFNLEKSDNWLTTTINACLSFLTGICVLSLSSWTEITLRFGPSEIELVFGICLTAYSAFNLIGFERLGSKRTRNNLFLILCLGTFIASGSKENGIISFILFIFIIYRERHWIFKSKFNIFAIFITSAEILAVTLSNLLVLIRGTGFYAEQRSIPLIFEAIYLRAMDSNFAILIISTSILFLLYRNSSSQRIFGHFVLAIFFDLIYISEGVFYSGVGWAVRYNILTQISMVLVPSLTWINLIAHFLRQQHRARMGSAIASLIFACGVVNYYSPVVNFFSMRKAAESRKEVTQSWKSELNLLTNKISIISGTQIVIQEFNYGSDFERIYSTIQFLRQRGITNPVYLLVKESASEDPLGQQLLQALNSMSIDGNKKWDIEPLIKLNADIPTFCIVFGIDLSDQNLFLLDFPQSKCTLYSSLKS